MLPALADEGLVDAVDVFCERIDFTLVQSERVFEVAAKRGIGVKMHAEQLSNSGGAALSARYRALSADHLEYLDEAGVAAMNKAGTVAVLLPGAYYFIRETQLPPLDLLRRYEVPIAISTDSNPGTSPVTSLLMMNMATTLFRMTVPEVLQGVTRHAARAFGNSKRHGLARRWTTGGFRGVAGAVDRGTRLLVRPSVVRACRARRRHRFRAQRALSDYMTTHSSSQALFAEHAWLPDGWRRNVLFEWSPDGALQRVTPDLDHAPHDVPCAAGPLVPGMLNLHSHAF